MVSMKVAVISALGLLGAVSAVPVAEVDYVNSIIPGEGLPTPKELGLTNADLTKPMPNEVSRRDNVFEKRYECRFTDVCKLNDARACFNYLLSLNETPCSVTRRPGQFCRMGRCSWVGQAENVDSSSSYCRDVAHGGNTVVERCRLGDITGGFNYAGGNGNVRVTLAGN